MARLREFMASSNDIEGLRELLVDENLNDQDDEGSTALHFAVKKIRSHPYEIDAIVQVARELISHGVDVNKADVYGKTPLHYAVMQRNYKMIELFLQSNADINKQTISGLTPLHYAVKTMVFEDNSYNIDESVVALLLKYNAHVDIQDREQRSPLILATIARRYYIVQRLLKKGTDVTLKDIRERTVMHYALHGRSVNFRIVEEFFRREASFISVDIDGETPIDFIFTPRVSLTELDARKKVLKLYLFQRKHFQDKLKPIVRALKALMNGLSRFFDLCYREMKLMRHEKLAPNVSVYQIALRGAFYSFRSPEHNFSEEVYEQILEKLLASQYPIYSDLIVSGICRPYLQRRLCEELYSIHVQSIFSEHDVDYCTFSWIPDYLSSFDILNAIKACRLQPTVPSDPSYRPSSTSETRCSIS